MSGFIFFPVVIDNIIEFPITDQQAEPASLAQSLQIGEIILHIDTAVHQRSVPDGFSIGAPSLKDKQRNR